MRNSLFTMNNSSAFLSETVSSNTMRFAFALFAVLALAGCLSSPPRPDNHYYTLLQPDQKIEWETGNEDVQLSVVSIPDYLKQSRLVMQSDSGKVTFANFHRWANNVESEIEHNLVLQSNKISSTLNYVNNCDNCSSIDIVVTNMLVSESGQAFFSGYWLAIDADNSTIRQSFLYQQAIDGDGYQSAVSSYRNLINKLATDIVQSSAD